MNNEPKDGAGNPIKEGDIVVFHPRTMLLAKITRIQEGEPAIIGIVVNVPLVPQMGNIFLDIVKVQLPAEITH